MADSKIESVYARVRKEIYMQAYNDIVSALENGYSNINQNDKIKLHRAKEEIIYNMINELDNLFDPPNKNDELNN